MASIEFDGKRIDDEMIPIEREERHMITVLYGTDSRKMKKEELKGLLLNFVEKQNGSKDRIEFTDISGCYLDIIEWIDVNLYRTVGIQLYEDGEVRLNFWPDFIEDGKKCAFLSDAFMVDDDMNELVYAFLKELVIEERGN